MTEQALAIAKEMLDRLERAAMAYERLGKITRDDEKSRELRKNTIAELAAARKAVCETVISQAEEIERLTDEYRCPIGLDTKGASEVCSAGYCVTCMRRALGTLRSERDTLTAELAEARAELARMREYAHEATKAITGLTCGGSEFFGKKIDGMYTADLPFCVERIRDRTQRTDNRSRKSLLAAQAAESTIALLTKERDEAYERCAKIADEASGIVTASRDVDVMIQSAAASDMASAIASAIRALQPSPGRDG